MRRRSTLGNKKNTLRLSNTSLTYSSEAGNGYVYVYYNDALLKADTGVTLNTSSSWMTLTWVSSSGYIRISFTANDDLNYSRTCTGYITYNGLTRQFTVTQQQATLSIQLSNSSQNLSAFGGTRTVQIKCNTSLYTGNDYTLWVQEDWATVTEPSGGAATLTYQMNLSGETRQLNIKITRGVITSGVYTTQNAARVITSIPYDGTIDGYKYLEISGNKWAVNDYGASFDGGYGYKYAWGEIATKSTYTSSNYKWGQRTSTKPDFGYTKYNYTDALTTLEDADNAVKVNMGGGWRMPTKNEFTNLNNNTTFEAAILSVNGNYYGGSIFKLKTDNSKYLFFNYNSGSSSIRWAVDKSYGSTDGYISYAHSLYLLDTYKSVTTTLRYVGYPVRGIHD